MLTNKFFSDQVTALIMAGGKGSRLQPFTEIRAKPAMYFGGKYRIVDFVLSNCYNSGINKISVITQYLAHSLISHIFKAWGFINGDLSGYIDILPASQQHSELWYRGTADSITQNLNIIKERATKYTLILAGDHIYKMDYRLMIEQHIEAGAMCSVGCVVVPKKEAKGFGVMHVNDSNKIVDFLEKPENPPSLPNDPEHCMASMGIYVFNTDLLIKILTEDFTKKDSSHDFGKDIIPKLVKKGLAYAHPFPNSCIKSSKNAENYWRDVGTIDSYWKTNLELVEPLPEFDLYDKSWPIRAFQPSFQPCKFIHNSENRIGYATDSMVSGDCVVSGGHVNKSILFYGSRINSYTEIHNSIILPKVNIGRNCKINNTIIEKNCVIPDGLVVGENIENDKKRFYVSENGIVVINKNMLKNL